MSYPLSIDSKCCQTHKVAKLIGDWQDIAKELELTEQEILGIKKDEHTEHERRVAMLDLWIKRKGSSATFRALLQACRNVGEGDVAEQIQHFIETGSFPATGKIKRKTGSGTVPCTCTHICIELLVYM